MYYLVLTISLFSWCFMNEVKLVLYVWLLLPYVDHPRCITLFEVEQHSRLMEESEHRHVFNFIKLWRVLWIDITLLHCDGL